MTMAELKSVEETLIKISLKTLYFIGAALVGSTFFAVVLYKDIISGQEAILNEVKKNAVERNWQVQDLRREDEFIKKNISAIESRVARIEN